MEINFNYSENGFKDHYIQILPLSEIIKDDFISDEKEFYLRFNEIFPNESIFIVSEDDLNKFNNFTKVFKRSH